MFYRTTKVLLTLSLLLVLATGCPTKPAPTPSTPAPTPAPTPTPAPAPAVTQQKDDAPNGCATCHVKSGDKDYTLAAEVKKISGHPTLKPDATVKDCVTCHGPTSDRPLGTILHKRHLAGKNYPAKYDTNCINCHKMLDTGKIIVKGLEGAETTKK